MGKRMVCAWIAAATVSIAAADAPFFGRWKLNTSKSDLGSSQVTFSRVAGDELQHTYEDGRSYKFKMDGKAYPEPFGGTATWKQVDANTWEVTSRLNGKVAAIDTYKLSPDGNTLTDTSKLPSTKDPLEASVVLHRTGGGPGLPGTWKGTPTISVFTLELVPFENDGLIFRIPDVFESKARFDGTPYPMTGPQAPTGSTAAFTKTGPLSFETTQTQSDGTVMMVATVTVSSDGKTLTEVGQIGPVRRTWVFDRQR